jgi:hypothetical protein
MDISLETYIKKVDNLLYIKEQNIGNNTADYVDTELQNMIYYIEQTLNYIKKRIYPDGLRNSWRPSSPIQATVTHHAPCTNLAWIDELGQYSININNMILRGNIGNIYDKRIINKSNVHTHQVTHCIYGNECRNVVSQKYCKYFHDPMDLLQLKKQGSISEEYFQSMIRLIRNFSNTAWLYTSNNSINRNLRCVGSAATLDNDIASLMLNNDRKNIIENYKQQVMHDILVLLVLHNKCIV